MERMGINMLYERKIVSVIRACLRKQETRFVIVPYGKWGKLVQDILNNTYKIKEIAVADNKQANENSGIISVDEISSIEGPFTILLATDIEEVRNELLVQLQNIERVNICDLAMIEEHTLYFPMNSPKLQIEECDEEQRRAIFETTRRVWEKLGKEEPYWSVITSKEYLIDDMNEEKLTKFYDSGYQECLSIIRTLERINVIQTASESKELEITEMGCGTGRVTKSLAKFFKKVNALDISSGNMAVAKRMTDSTNVHYCLIKRMEDYDGLPETDIVYSSIVLQHNCPPVIEYILSKMFESLRVNGVCIFQVPTYCDNYSFSYEAYMSETHDKMEMHLLPQKIIFEIANRHKCIPVEVYQDGKTGKNDFSTTFVFKKLI